MPDLLLANPAQRLDAHADSTRLESHGWSRVARSDAAADAGHTGAAWRRWVRRRRDVGSGPGGKDGRFGGIEHGRLPLPGEGRLGESNDRVGTCGRVDGEAGFTRAQWFQDVVLRVEKLRRHEMLCPV